MADIYPLIESEFPAGGTDSSDGSWRPGSIGPVDILTSRVREVLVDDSKLIAIFGNADGIERRDEYPLEDYDTLPKLYVYPTSVDSIDSPTQLNVETVTVFLGVRYTPFRQTRMANYAPGINTLLSYLRAIAYRDLCEVRVTEQGSTTYLVGDRFELSSGRLIPEEMRDGTITNMFELALSWRLRVDIPNARLQDQPAP